MKGEQFLEALAEDHPIKIVTYLNKEFKWYLIDLIDFLSKKKIENLDLKLNELKKDKSNWESYVCELEFCRRVVDLSPRFIPSKEKGKTPDIKISLNEEDIFFEVKLLKNVGIGTELFKRVSEIISDYVVIINYDPLNLSKEYIKKAYQLILSNIKKRETGKFNVDNILDMEIKEKKDVAKEFKEKSRTWVILSMKQSMWIDVEKLKIKVLLDFYNKQRQFKSVKNIFWVIDLRRWQYNIDDLKKVFYGNIVTDYTVGIRNFVGFNDIYRVFRKNPGLFDDTNLIPCLTYPKKDGLFFNEEFKILNGVIGIKGNKSLLLINPFARDQLDILIIKKLKEVINNGPSKKNRIKERN